jgi:hypothetical protein
MSRTVVVPRAERRTCGSLSWGDERTILLYGEFPGLTARGFPSTFTLFVPQVGFDQQA